VDDEGNPWQVGRCFGGAYVEGRPGGGAASNFPYGNRYAPPYIREGTTVFSEEGQGDQPSTKMVFPTPGTFLLSAVMPGKVFFDFRPGGRGERVREILYRDEDILKTGLVTQAGEEIKDILSAIGKSERP
jgi:hypothetical protein